MDYGSMLGDSFEYSKEALLEKWVKWILLIIPFMAHGYSVEIYKGTKPAPEVNDWVATFIKGIILAIINIIYFIPIFIIAAISFLPLILGAIAGAATGDMTALMTGIGAGVGLALIGLLICVLLAIIVILLLPISFIRYSRTDSFGEAFNVSAIRGQISKIGWVSYIIAIVVLIIAAIVYAIIMFIIHFILGLIPLLGALLLFVIDLAMIPAVTIFVARYFTQIYDSVGA